MTVIEQRDEIAQTDCPVDVRPTPAAASRHPLRWTSVTIAWAALLLTAGNAAAVQAWIDEVPPRWSNDWLRAPIAALNAATTHAGLDRVHVCLHRWWEAAQAARFGAETPDDAGGR